MTVNFAKAFLYTRLSKLRVILHSFPVVVFSTDILRKIVNVNSAKISKQSEILKNTFKEKLFRVNVLLLSSFLGTGKGHSTSAYLFILCLEILFLNIKIESKVEEINIFNYLHTVYADNTTFFSKNQDSILVLLETMKQLSTF